MACILADIVFIPYGPKGSKTYITAKKVIDANIPVFTLDHPECNDLHNLGILGFNRKTIKAFLEEKGVKVAVPKNSISNLIEPYKVSEDKTHSIKEPAQTKLKY